MRIGAIIPCRSEASRLPGKPLLDVAGVTALERVVSRARACRDIEEIVVATTQSAGDDRLCELARGLSLSVYRGSRDDVLQRIAHAAEAAALDVIVEIDGDDLLCAPEYMASGINALRATGADYLRYSGLPLGATPNLLRSCALRRVLAQRGDRNTSTGFFKELESFPGFASTVLPIQDADHVHNSVRMTLDYPEDLEFFRAVYRALDPRGSEVTFAGLVAMLRERPDLVKINQGLEQRYWEHYAAGVQESRAGDAFRADTNDGK